MHGRSIAILLLGVLGLLGSLDACVEDEFLRGTECSRDEDCGRSLTCMQGRCGGCPLDVEGDCPCPGERVYDCRVLAGPTYCVPVCSSAVALCTVAELDGEQTNELQRCNTEGMGPPPPHCFDVITGANDCEPGLAEIRVSVDGRDTGPPGTGSADTGGSGSGGPDTGDTGDTGGPTVQLVVNCPPPQTEGSQFTCE